MSVFWALAATLSALAVLFIVPPLLGRGAPAGPSRDRLNAAIYRERIAELDEEFPPHERDGEPYRQARDALLAELQRELEGERVPAMPAPPEPRPVLAVAIAGAVPFAALLGYLALGEPLLFFADARGDGSAAPAGPPANAATQTPSIDEMVTGLERRLAAAPGDIEGWILLGRSYAEIGRLEEARGALERGLAVNPVAPDLLVSLAESLGQARGNDLRGEPTALLARAVAAAPEHRKALWLGGIAALQGGRNEAALRLWERLRAVQPMSPEETRLLDQFIAQAGGSGASSSPAPRTQAAGETESTRAPGAAQPQGVHVRVAVALAPALAGKVSPEDTVFVFARAREGPRMPLAIVRRRASDLPFEVELDDSLAMMPALRLSGFPEVVVGARISRTGDAMPRPGDLVGESPPLSTAGSPTVRISIEREVR